ncbi:hypothetical protein B0H14DRAFT_3154810 [Mycena olivaceomarginata]|nr:hypothetical protein B0H14DRAFT_3154810 [Mycena olivaceomarginata]
MSDLHPSKSFLLHRAAVRGQHVDQRAVVYRPRECENIESLTVEPDRRPPALPTHITLLDCTNLKWHGAKDFTPVTRFVKPELVEAIRAMEQLINLQDPRPAIQPWSHSVSSEHASSGNTPYVTADIPAYEIRRFADHELPEEVFCRVWADGDPLLVTDIGRKLKLPDNTLRDGREETAFCGAVLRGVWGLRRANELLEAQGLAALKGLPGSISGALPRFRPGGPHPDICLKRRGAEHCVTLSVEYRSPRSRAENVQRQRKPSRSGWPRLDATAHGYSRRTKCHDVCRTRPGRGGGLCGVGNLSSAGQYKAPRVSALKLHNGSTGAHPQPRGVLRRRRLWAKYGVQSYRVYQRAGEAIFIPAGCAHQVWNLSDCIKVAIDFVSPENVARCETLTQQFRKQNESEAWKKDVLQLRTMMWFAWLSIIREEILHTTRFLYMRVG